MKNVLIYFNNYCSETSQGGTEVATFRIAKALKESGECRLFHAFHNGSLPKRNSVFEYSIRLTKNPGKLMDTLADFIRNKEIDDVIVMSRFFKFGMIKEAAVRSGRAPKLFFMQHFAPGSERKKTTYRASWHLLKFNPTRPRYILRALFYPLIKLPRTLRWSRVYKRVYQQADNVILLSEGYKKDYTKVAGVNDESKFLAIPNIFEMSPDFESKSYPKEKRVLILSRMDEIQKRLSLALQVWKNIEADPDFSDWHLDIVGDGNNTDIVKRLIKSMGLKNVTMHGWQPREKFLQRSPVLMMTSEYEGLPLTLLEAQAYGCVPIAFDSFASLRDVVAPFETGVIVEKFGDVKDYTQKLKDLLLNADYREDLAANASKHHEEFSSKKIAEKWLKILK